LSNGFRELQYEKMRSAGIDSFFKKVILSEDIKIMKPYTEIFHFALSTTQSELKESVMIGDSWDADIVGAYRVGMDQFYVNEKHKTDTSFKPTCRVKSLLELKPFL